MYEKLTFLEEGKYTKINKKIREFAKIINSADNSLDYIGEVVRNFNFDRTNKKEIFRKRSAIEIINSNFVTGCTDEALVYITFARAAGIPSRYVETLLDVKDNKVMGHVFVDVFTNGEWQVRDPKIGPRLNNKYALLGKDYKILGKGLDFSQIYLFGVARIAKKPVVIDSMKAFFKYVH